MSYGRYVKWKFFDLCFYAVGLVAAFYIMFNSFEGGGIIDMSGFIPGLAAAAAIIHAITFRWKSL